MADRGAVMRALQGGMGGAGRMGRMDMDEGGLSGGMPPPDGRMPRPGQEDEGQDNPMDSEAIANGIQGLGMYIQSEAKKGNPAAQAAMGHFQALLGVVAEMVGGQAPGAPQNGEQEGSAAGAGIKNRPPAGVLQEARSYSRGTPAGTLGRSEVVM